MPNVLLQLIRFRFDTSQSRVKLSQLLLPYYNHRPMMITEHNFGHIVRFSCISQVIIAVVSEAVEI